MGSVGCGSTNLICVGSPHCGQGTDVVVIDGDDWASLSMQTSLALDPHSNGHKVNRSRKNRAPQHTLLAAPAHRSVGHVGYGIMKNLAKKRRASRTSRHSYEHVDSGIIGIK
jgi:hypothetical protein